MSKKSTTSKGTESERLCEEFLKELRLETWRVRRQKFGNMDMFGLFDVVAHGTLHDGQGYLRFIQVKTNRKPDKATIDRMVAWAAPPYCTKEIWIHHTKGKYSDSKEHPWTIIRL